MITIPQSEMNLILNRRIRKRTLILPVRQETIRSARHPKTGRVLARVGESVGTVTKRCPVAEGGSYDLQARPPHERYDCWLREAEGKPTRAGAVLWLIERCEQPRKTIRITVRKVERQGANWIVTFSPDDKEELRDVLAADQPVFLARGSGYSSVDEIGAGELMGPFAKDLAEARKKMREGRVAPERKAVRRAAAELETCRQVMSNMKAAVLLKRAQRNLEAAERILASEADVYCETRTAADGSQGEAERPPRGAHPPCARAA